MSRWRINLGVGPVRYSQPIGGSKPRRPRRAWGTVLAVLVTLGLVYLARKAWGTLMSRGIE